MSFGTVVESKLLTTPGAPVKKHIGTDPPLRLSIPSLLTFEKRCHFRKGQHTAQATTLQCKYCPTLYISLTNKSLYSLPTNPERVVRRAIGRFGLSEEQEVIPKHNVTVYDANGIR